MIDELEELDDIVLDDGSLGVDDFLSRDGEVRGEVSDEEIEYSNGLRLSCLRRLGDIEVSKGGVRLRLRGGNMRTSSLVNMLRADNMNIYDIDYPDDIDESELINISDVPYWGIRDIGGGEFFIKRLHGV